MLSIITILTSFSIASSNIFADTTDSKVTTNYSLYDNLSSQQKQQIITGQPNIKLAHDNEKLTLVYKNKVNSQPLTSNNGDNHANAAAASTTVRNGLTDKPLLANQSTELPQTAQGNSDRLLLSLILIIVIALGLLFWKRKYMRHILLAYVILGGSLAAIGLVNAAVALPNEQTQTLVKGTTYSPNTAQDGYDYVGYIYSYTNPSEPLPDNKGQVTVYYQDAQGKNIGESIILNGSIGNSYTTSAKKISGYKLKANPTNATGTFTKANQNVIYIYTKDVLQGHITLKIDSTTNFAGGYIEKAVLASNPNIDLPLSDRKSSGDIGTAYQLPEDFPYPTNAYQSVDVILYLKDSSGNIFEYPDNLMAYTDVSSLRYTSSDQTLTYYLGK